MNAKEFILPRFVIFAGLSIGKSKSGGRRSPNGVHLINPGSEGTEPREYRRQNTELRTTNPEPQTTNSGLRTPNHQAATENRCRDRMAIAGRSPGGRPLRRRRERVLIYGRQRLRGTEPREDRIQNTEDRIQN